MSDVVAYVLVFAIILSGVALVAGGAFDPLIELSDREQVENSERGMKAAAATLDDIHRQSGTQRTFNIVPGGGTVFLNRSNITVSAGAMSRTYTVNAVEHEFDRPFGEVTLAYEAGAVFRSPGASARYEPSITCGEDVAIVSLVRLQGGNFYISAGQENVEVLNPRSVPSDAPVADLGRAIIFNAETVNTTRAVTSLGGDSVSVNVSDTAVPNEWEEYFERGESDWKQQIGSPGVYECLNVEEALVRTVMIRLETGY